MIVQFGRLDKFGRSFKS